MMKKKKGEYLLKYACVLVIYSFPLLIKVACRCECDRFVHF
jgi:hypothetical protein